MTNLSIECLKSEKTDSGALYGQFLINSLNPGQGVTVGNILRRILLFNTDKKYPRRALMRGTCYHSNLLCHPDTNCP